MLSKMEFKSIEKDLKRFEELREAVIIKAREIIQLSKLIIYAIHRDDLKGAASYLKQIKNKFRYFPKESFDTEIHRTAIQEYVEAACYYEVVKNKRIPTRKELKVSTENYLLGLCDLTGELVRKAVADAIKRNFKEVLEIKNLVEEIHGQFLKFDLRNSELRKKSDMIRWNLKKLEDVVYDLKKWK